MASFDEIKQQAEQAANTVAGKAVEAAEAANEWVNTPHPEIDEAFEKGSEFSEDAVNKIAEGLDSVYEAIKNKAEELTGIDTDADGKIGNTGEAPGEVKAGLEVAAEAVAGAAGATVGFAKGAIDAITQKVTEVVDDAEAAPEAAPEAETAPEAEAAPEAAPEAEAAE